MAKKNQKSSKGSYKTQASSRTGKTLAASVLSQRNAESGKFADGVKMVTRRDRAGLIKLADR